MTPTLARPQYEADPGDPQRVKLACVQSPARFTRWGSPGSASYSGRARVGVLA